MRAVAVIFAIIIIIAVGVQIYRLYIQNAELRETALSLTKEIEDISKENALLQADLEYFSNPENLEKELKSESNLKNPGEKLIIVLPPKAATTQ
ncbi:MAG: septum formation initiator family protein [Candidatus Pacebacteria bacterium]|nr:septum formation initiator family protein [Candidatus Paceibacterota bacterium]